MEQSANLKQDVLVSPLGGVVRGTIGRINVDLPSERMRSGALPSSIHSHGTQQAEGARIEAGRGTGSQQTWSLLGAMAIIDLSLFQAWAEMP